MAKYHELVECSKDAIKEIKEMQKEQAELQSQIGAIQPYGYDGDIDIDKIDEHDRLCEQWQEVSEELAVLWANLDEWLQAEYEDVPYAKAARQGIAGFYREAGLVRN